MNQKINEVGNKLDLKASETFPDKSSRKQRNLVFWGIHATTLLLSGILGFVFGEMHQYPYSFTPLESFPPFGLNIINGAITLPPRKLNSKHRALIRVALLCANVVLSVLIYVLVFVSREDFSNSCYMGVCVLYGVYGDTDE